MAGKIKLQLTGFDSLLEEIQKAEGDIKQVVTDCMQKEINITKQCLIEECVKSGVPDSVTREITEEPVKWENERASCAVGWKMGSYDPKNPSAGYKAVFLNYGTPKKRATKQKGQRIFVNGKWITLGENRGTIDQKGFVQNAKKKAARLAKKEHEASLNKILGDLKK